MDAGYCFYSDNDNRDRTLNQSYASIINTGFFVNYKIKDYLFLESVLGVNRLQRRYELTDRIYNPLFPETDLGEVVLYRSYTSSSGFLSLGLGFNWRKIKIKFGTQLGLVFFFRENDSQAVNYSFVSEVATILNYRFKDHFLQVYNEFYTEFNYPISGNLDVKLSVSFNNSSNRYDVFEPRSKLVIGLNAYF